MLKLPELPDGYFWRVGRESFGWVCVELRVKRRLFGSHRVEWHVAQPTPTVEAAIRRAANRCMRDFEERQEKNEALKKLSEYEGDYGK